MKLKYFFFTFYIAFASQNLFAQHIRLDKKEMSFLASQKKINVVFTYEDVLFNSDNLNEREFRDHIKGKIEDKLNKKEALEWERKYFKSKDSVYPKIFVAALNNRIKNYDHPIEFVWNDPSIKYTMKVQTNWMYFGYNVGVVKQPAKGNLKISFYETSKPETIISTIDIDRAEGIDLAIAGSLSFYSNLPGQQSGGSMFSKKWLDEFLKAKEEYPRPSLIRMGNMYDKAAVRFGMTLKRVLD